MINLDEYALFEDTHRKELIIDGRPSYVEIFDLPGIDTTARDGESWRQDHIGLLKTPSFESIPALHRLFLEMDGTDRPHIYMLVGNKCDRDDSREVSSEEGEILARERGWIFYETSAKANINVKEIMEELARKTLPIAETNQITATKKKTLFSRFLRRISGR
ncbi:hypothetical protein H0H87_005234 [Tephrocybe sp. NHM501043]|nr:hypothetical protein H0H87_005234 [Tephrocybe sp. NHM501043]